jgi:pyruvate dehydrogenase E2 component (dihydrolipoamide acetyltransferase)
MISEIIIPVMDQATETVLLTGWRKQEGEAVRKGEAICDIETEKASVEIEAAASGVLRKTLAAAGDRVAPRTVIGLIADATEALPDLARYAPGSAAEPPAATTQPAAMPTSTATAARTAPAAPAAGGRIMASPRAKRLAEEHHIDLKTVRGTGPEGRIQEEDVAAAVAMAKAAPDPAARAARAKAERVSLSWRTIPHFYTTITADMSQVTARKARAGSAATYTDFIALAIGQALVKFPALNGYWKDDAAVAVPEIRLGLVVQAERGLMIAGLRDLRGRAWDSVSAEREHAVQQALAGKLEAGAGEPTFTLSNIGPGHIDHFTAIINPPQVAILSVGSILPRPVVVGDALVIRPTASFTLGVDHRAIDGRLAAAFLEELKLVLEAAED